MAREEETSEPYNTTDFQNRFEPVNEYDFKQPERNYDPRIHESGNGLSENEVRNPSSTRAYDGYKLRTRNEHMGALGRMLKEYREEKSVSQEELTELLQQALTTQILSHDEDSMFQQAGLWLDGYEKPPRIIEGMIAQHAGATAMAHRTRAVLGLIMPDTTEHDTSKRNATTGAQLKQILQLNGLSIMGFVEKAQREAASLQRELKTGSYIDKIERGLSIPSLSAVLLISDALGLSPARQMVSIVDYVETHVKGR